MCAIVGIASTAPVGERDWIALGRDAMRHRGPDDAGEWWSADGCAGFGHRRLSIIDLSPAAHQPMQDASGELCIVFNGEIYNFADLRGELAARGHAFRSHSDTEVILAAYHEWGTDCLARLNGMFAFALYDGRKRQLFMARDRAGEKPLFYALAGGTLRFASELKGLMADPAFPRRVDLDALDCYLFRGFVSRELCLLQGARKLPPAHALVFDLASGQSRLWPYWKLPELEVSAGSRTENEAALLEELESLLEDAVRRQLLVADVPVGVLLSGGVDSSLVTAMAARASSTVKTFTIRFPGYGQYDETEHARLIARCFGTEHVELAAPESSASLLSVLARQFDEPIVDSSMIPTYLVSQLVRGHCTVALGGDGGDELFGGYPHHSRMLWMQQKLHAVPLSLRRFVGTAAEALLPIGFKGRRWLANVGVDWRTGLPPPVNACFDSGARRNLMARHGILPLSAEFNRGIPQAGDLLQRATRQDFGNYMAEDILVKVDRASMLSSLEIRAPLLDHRMIEFAFRKVPSHLKATASDRKILLKKLAARVLPADFDRHRKQGFSIPLNAWLRRGPWREYFREVLLSPDNHLFDRKFVGGLLDGEAKGLVNSERLFALVIFELWRREYQVSI